MKAILVEIVAALAWAIRNAILARLNLDGGLGGGGWRSESGGDHEDGGKEGRGLHGEVL